MELLTPDISWTRTIAATFAYFLLGGLWFSQFGFGKQLDQ